MLSSSLLIALGIYSCSLLLLLFVVVYPGKDNYLLDEKDLTNRFTYHAPNPQQIEIYAQIRAIAHAYAVAINELVPDSREKSLAITKLEEVVMWANAGVARNS